MCCAIDARHDHHGGSLRIYATWHITTHGIEQCGSFVDATSDQTSVVYCSL